VEVLAPGPFAIERVGWGTFEIDICVEDKDGRQHHFKHDLVFSKTPVEHLETILIRPQQSLSSVFGELAQQRAKLTPQETEVRHADGSRHVERVSSAGVEVVKTLDVAPATAPLLEVATQPSKESDGQVAAAAAAAAPKQCMTGVSIAGMHGSCGKKEWAPPILVVNCDAMARPGYASMKAHEYVEDPETLKEKVKMLAELLKKARNCVAYTGAGISTSSGIDDYASKAAGDFFLHVHFALIRAFWR